MFAERCPPTFVMVRRRTSRRLTRGGQTVDQEFRYQPAVLKIAEALREADQERLAHEARRRGSDHQALPTVAASLVRAKLHHAR
jgi:hypothetical protein